MSAKSPKKGANPPAAPAPAPVAPSTGAAGTVAHSSWLDSADPRKRMWGKVIFFAVWIYVGALWLLALDQTFHWGIFGPKGPPGP